MPPPFKNATCRGSYLLGSACGKCERCADERTKIGPISGSGVVDEVTVQVSLANLRELITAAQECADDLQTEFESQYPSRLDQPVQMRRFNRDMQVVDRAKRAIQSVDVCLPEPIYRYE